MPRVNKITFKVSSTEREELNMLIKSNASSISDLVREALRNYYNLQEFEPSYMQTVSKSYENKWRIY